MSFRNRLLILLALFLSAMTSYSASAGSWSQTSAREEFEELKVSGNWLNYISAGSYGEVLGTNFIALESADDSERTCLYGFHLDSSLAQSKLNARTRFVCFRTGRFEIRQVKEFCMDGEPACAIDPAQISIGIGNIRIVEPTLQSLGRTDAAQVFGRYPSRVSIKIFPGSVPPTEVEPRPLRPLAPGLPWTEVPSTLKGIRWGS